MFNFVLTLNELTINKISTFHLFFITVRIFGISSKKNPKMNYVIICLVALIGSGLTLFSGFGLGTLLTPVFAFFFPIELAIAMTAIVHFANNLFKLGLMGKYANWAIVWRFGGPSVLAAFTGAFLLKQMSNANVLTNWQFQEKTFDITLIKITIGILFIFFALWEIIPFFAKLTFDKKHLLTGGLLSGFFGGLSGMQGALRSAFLTKVGLSKEAFIGTGVVIACLIDTARLAVYAERWSKNAQSFDYTLVVAATLSAFIGAYFGSKILKKITIKTIQNLVAALLFIFAILLISGVL
jgi:uncharacterized protein